MSDRPRRIKVEPEPSPEIVAAIVAALSAVDGDEGKPEQSSLWKRRSRPVAGGARRGTRMTWRDRARLGE